MALPSNPGIVKVDTGSATTILLVSLKRPGKKWMQSSKEQVRESDRYKRGISSTGKKICSFGRTWVRSFYSRF